MLYSALSVYEFRQSEQFRHDEKRHERHIDWANLYLSKCESKLHIGLNKIKWYRIVPLWMVHGNGSISLIAFLQEPTN